MLGMPANSTPGSLVEEQLLRQLGARLRAARKARGLSAAELSAQIGISRTTLTAVESGDPSPTFGTYTRVFAALGYVADLALLASQSGGVTLPSASTRRSIASGRHRPQDLQSLLMHRAAVALLRADPTLTARLQDTLARWQARDDANSRPLLDRWATIIAGRDWDIALAATEESRQLRQASPLPTLLSEGIRMDIIRQVRTLNERQHAPA